MICNLTKVRRTTASLLLGCALALPVQAEPMPDVIEVPTVAKTIARGHIIASADLTMQPIHIKRLAKDALLQKKDLIGKEATRTLRPGRPIHASLVRTPPAARSGQSITIAFKLQNLIVQAKGRALEDGNTGDVIRVMNTASKSVIDAKVVGNNIVIVQQ